MKMRFKDGFSLLELMVVLAIMGTATLFAVPTIKDWQIRNSLNEAIAEINSGLVESKQISFAKNTTSRILVSKAGNNYTINVYSLPAASSVCDSSLATWSLNKTKTFTLNSNFNITGFSFWINP